MKSQCQGQEEVKQPSLFKWAKHAVNDLGSRSKTLVSRVLSVGSSFVSSHADFESATKDKEVWTQSFVGIGSIDDSSAIQGLNIPV